MPNQYVNKVSLSNGSDLIDISDTTAVASDVATGKAFYLATGEKVVGTASGETGYVWQDEQGYVHLSDEQGNNTIIEPLSVTQNGTYTASSRHAYSPVSVNVQPSLQSKSTNPTESAQTITPDSGYHGLSKVDVGAISSTYVGSGIARKSSSDLTASGATVTAPAGYYASQATKSVATMTLPTSASSSSTAGYTSKATISRSTSDQYINIPTGYNSAGAYYKVNAVPNGTVTAPSSISGTAATVSTGTNTLTLSKTVSVTPNVSTAGYVSAGTAGNSSVSLTATVNTRSSSDLTASGATVTAPAGYYASQATKSVSSMTLPTSASSSATSGYTSKATIGRSTSNQYINIPTGYNSAGAYYTISAVANGTAGTPTASKGTVSNHSVSVTPSVTNTTGYITGSTLTGTAVTVSASELVSGTKTITENGTGIDVINYANVDVSVNATPYLQSKTVFPSNEDQIITPDLEIVDHKNQGITYSAHTQNSTTSSALAQGNVVSGNTYIVKGTITVSDSNDVILEQETFQTSITISTSYVATFEKSGNYISKHEIQLTARNQFNSRVTYGKSASFKADIVFDFLDPNVVQYDGLSQVIVKAMQIEPLTVTPTSTDQTFTASGQVNGYSPVTVSAAQSGGSMIPFKISAPDSNNARMNVRFAASTTSSVSGIRSNTLTTSETTYYLPEAPGYPGWGLLFASSASLSYWPLPQLTSGGLYTINTGTSGSMASVSIWRIQSDSVITMSTSDKN